METDEIIAVLINAENKRLIGATKAIGQLRKLEESHADLLAALEDLVGYAAAEIGIPPNEAVGGAFKQARAAIAKAKGQQ